MIEKIWSWPSLIHNTIHKISCFCLAGKEESCVQKQLFFFSHQPNIKTLAQHHHTSIPLQTLRFILTWSQRVDSALIPHGWSSIGSAEELSKCCYHRVQHALNLLPSMTPVSFLSSGSFKDKCMYSGTDYPADSQQIFGWRMSHLRIQPNMKLSGVQTGRGAEQLKTWFRPR